MRHPQHPRPRPRRTAGWAIAVVLGAAALTSGCTRDEKRGWLPGTDHTTSTTGMTRELWIGSWIAGLLVGVLVWGLTIWCIVRYRRRKDETGLPPQLRYNVPLEILYTIVPLFMVGVLFFYTARDESTITKRYHDPDVKVQVVAKRWSWDFNYQNADVYDSGVQARSNDTSGVVENHIPVLWLPVGEKVQLQLNSRDVDHDFWVAAWDYKEDVIPGRTNYMSITPQEKGTYIGRCAELCGEYHSQMLFKVKVTSRSDYQAHLAALKRAGQTGQLSASLGPGQDNPKLDEHESGTGQEAKNTGSNG